MTAPTQGHMELRFRLSNDVLPHASSGPMVVTTIRTSARGNETRLYKGALTVTLLPWMSSEIFGNHVPHKTVKQSAQKSRLLNMKLDSRETTASSLCSLRRCLWFCT